MKTSLRKAAKFLWIGDSAEQLKLMAKLSQQCCDPKTVELICQSQPHSALMHLEACLHMARDLPCLILLDLYLPTREAGWQLLEQIRQLPTPACYLPVLVLSCSQDQHDIEQSYHRGATTYLFKPDSITEWIKLLQGIQEYWLSVVTLPRRRLVQ